MRGEKINFCIFVKDVLSPVSMMDIPIDDQNAGKLVLSNCLPRRNSHIVEQTEPHWIIGQRVMPRRTCQTAGSSVLFF